MVQVYGPRDLDCWNQWVNSIEEDTEIYKDYNLKKGWCYLGNREIICVIDY